MVIDEILIIKHDDINYAIPTSNIEQIQHIPELTPIALAPYQIKGMTAVGGNIRTVLDTNLLLDLDQVNTACPKSRLLTLTDPYHHLALLISEVVESTLVNQETIEYINDPDDAVVAIYRMDDEIVQILDLELLIQDIGLRKITGRDIKDNNKNLNEHLEHNEFSSERYLVFKMADERYALKIDYLREIISMPESFTDIAGSRSEIEGMIQLREELLVVADLRRYYNFAESRTDKNRILVANINGRHMGLIVDEIIDIRDFELKNVEEMPDNFKDGKLSGIYHAGDHLISIIGEQILSTLTTDNEKLIVNEDSEQRSDESKVALEAVVFKLGDEEYAINIEEVAEIIDSVEVTAVPDSPALIDGIINIRGQVVTVGSLHKRLGIECKPLDDRKIIVCEAGKQRIGFAVDSVSDVMNIFTEEMRPEEDGNELFTNVLHLDEGERLVMLFDLDKIFTKKEAA
jgi:purine-binding chemotaxis protein CheW